MNALGLCPDCGTELMVTRGWCPSCKRVLRPSEVRRAQLAAEAARAEALAALGPPVDPRYRQAVQRQQEKPPRASIWCAPADLEETGDGWLGLLVVLGDAGWALYETRSEDRIVLWAANADGSYIHGVNGDTAKDRALSLFKALYSSEPDAIACAAAFWPPPAPPEPVAQIGAQP